MRGPPPEGARLPVRAAGSLEPGEGTEQRSEGDEAMARAKWPVAGLVAVAMAATLAAGVRAWAVTDEDVTRAVDEGRQALLAQQSQDGSWTEEKYPGALFACGHTEMALYTLLYIGEHPNSEAIRNATDAMLARPTDYTYALSWRIMALAKLQEKLTEGLRDRAREELKKSVAVLVGGQGAHGGWDYRPIRASGYQAATQARFDLSNTQMAILALWEASQAGIEIPTSVWQRTQTLYLRLQHADDGSWNYGDPNNMDHGANSPGYGSMTAAGLATLFITSDLLEPGSGCPCGPGRSAKAPGDMNRRIDAAMKWMEVNFTPDANPQCIDPTWMRLYWLYGVERVGMASGYQYFGAHNWYQEGARSILATNWMTLPDLCFAMLFLYKGRAPVLYNKLQFKGEWNNHRRDIANLTSYIIKAKEQLFQWQTVGLPAPMEELHAAPILYITAETPPEFSEADKKKLREFTDTGGTILFEASCGNPAVRKWFKTFAKEVWPEWALKPLGPEHGSFLDPYRLRQRPEIFGLDDGLRTFLFYAMDDVSCAWSLKSVASREYLFRWGINLYTYATDYSPLRTKLETADSAKPSERYATPIQVGSRQRVTLARLKYDGPWATGRQYRPMERLTQFLRDRLFLTLDADEAGLEAKDLKKEDVALLVGGGGELTMSAENLEALKAYLGRGGFLWVESAGGSADFDKAVRKLAEDAGWELKPIDKTHALLTGRFPTAVGYNVATGVEFRRALRVVRLGRAYAELVGIYQNGKLVGIHSPFDILFSLTGYEAYGLRGYKVEDAMAVAMNILLYASEPPALP